MTVTAIKRQRFVMGNWKMHGSPDTVQKLLVSLKKITLKNTCSVIVFPPFIYLDQTRYYLQDSFIQWGGQNLCSYDPVQGAYTGEISAQMLRSAGCQYVLLGHSERRQYCNETNDLIMQKFINAAQSGLKSVLCVGETLEEYQAGQTQQKVLAQIESVLKSPLAMPYLDSLMIAYEPVWAIGTGLTAAPEQTQTIHQFIRRIAAGHSEIWAAQLTILYGGSVKASNAETLFALPDINGVLVGGASLNSEEFTQICHAAES